MPEFPQGQARAPALLVWSLVFLALVVVPLNFYNVARHHDSIWWVAAAVVAAILVYAGLGLTLWGRLAKRS